MDLTQCIDWVKKKKSNLQHVPFSQPKPMLFVFVIFTKRCQIKFKELGLPLQALNSSAQHVRLQMRANTGLAKTLSSEQRWLMKWLGFWCRGSRFWVAAMGPVAFMLAAHSRPPRWGLSSDTLCWFSPFFFNLSTIALFLGGSFGVSRRPSPFVFKER